MNKYVKSIVILVIAVLISVAIHLGLTAKYADWLSTDGVITDVAFHKSSIRRRTNDTYEICYTYTVEGQTYSGVNAYSGNESKTDAAAGQKVTVWYDPDNHGNSSFHKPWSALEPFVPLLLGAGLIARTLRDKKHTKRGGKRRGNTETNG